MLLGNDVCELVVKDVFTLQTDPDLNNSVDEIGNISEEESRSSV